MPVHLNDDLYQETKNIALKRGKKSPLVNELSVWFSQKYSVKLLNIEFIKINPRSDLHRLSIIIGNEKDYSKMLDHRANPRSDYQGDIWNKFRELSEKHNFTNEANLENILVTFCDFSDEAKTEANWKSEKEVKEFIKTKYSVVWNVEVLFGSIVVFYHFDKDIVENKNNGINKMIVDDYFVILKKYDDLNYFTKENIVVKFDSEENLNLNYGGSLFNYSR